MTLLTPTTPAEGPTVPLPDLLDVPVLPDLPVIEMVRPVLGFPGSRRYTLVRLDDDGVLCALTSLDEPGVGFVVAPAAAFFPDLDTRVDAATAAELGLPGPRSADGSGDAVVLLSLYTSDAADD